MPRQDDPLLIACLSAIVLTSLATWAYLTIRLLLRGALLSYEPRRPVPWGAVGALLACLWVLNSLTMVFLREPPVPVAQSVSPLPSPESPRPAAEPQVATRKNSPLQMVTMVVFILLLTGSVLAAIATYSGATMGDLGLPEFADEFARDVAIGVVACFAALPPVYGLLALLFHWFQGETHHPLIETLMHDSNPGFVMMATISAVIVAPVCEEITFRLLLQGWLEKCDDELRTTDDKIETTYGECQVTNEGENCALEPLRRKLACIPRGWLPIFVSSALFAAAHIGQGTAPFALFLLAIVLGYTYQRTHRIVPCITLHATFNLLNMLVLWLSLTNSSR
jgi:membrane protease YdiL (CAAX protease family)